MTIYEYPFNERMRFMMRLEHLFKQLFAFGERAEAQQQHVALGILFQLMEVCERGDCRNWVLQELEKCKASLEAYRHFSDIDVSALDERILRLNQVSRGLSSSNKLGSHVRENEWLLNLRNRFLTPGATSTMDFPAYTAWLNGPDAQRKQVLNSLIAPFIPLYEAIEQALELVREAAIPQVLSSKVTGVYEQALGGRMYQMVRVWLPEGQSVYPEISGNKHLVMIRFSVIDAEFRSQIVNQVVNFKMALCQI